MKKIAADRNYRLRKMGQLLNPGEEKITANGYSATVAQHIDYLYKLSAQWAEEIKKLQALGGGGTGGGAGVDLETVRKEIERAKPSPVKKPVHVGGGEYRGHSGTR